MDDVVRLENFARAGYVSRAVVYFLLGYLTFATRHSEGTASVLSDIKDLPAGNILLLVTGFGLAAYGLFRTYGALIDIQDEGSGIKGYGKRIGHIASGLAHLALAVIGAKLVLVGGGGSGSGGTQATKMVLSFPGGGIVIAIVGIGFLLAGLDQALKAITAKFVRLLDPDIPFWGCWMGRIGYAARAVVFLVLGWHMVASAWMGKAKDVGFQATLSDIRDTRPLYYAVAIGLAIFGLFSLFMARYRKIREGDLMDRIREGKAKLF